VGGLWIELVTVLMMTDDDATQNASLDADCAAYLRTPFAPQLLLDALEKAVA
jgi:DNA-binding NarL/FixJ family response regulator